MQDQATGALEPGVLPTFRLFIGMQLLIGIVGMLANWLLPFGPSAPVPSHFPGMGVVSGVANQSTLIVLVSLPLFIYLSLPGLLRLLKGLYLPVGIIWASVWPMLIPYIEFYTARAGAENSPELLQRALWQQVILLFIPLIVISWQYSIRQVVLFCLLTTLLNHVLLFSVSAAMESGEFRAPLGLILVQAVGFFLVGHMIANLVQVQREQRHSLVEANRRLAQYASTVEQLTLSRERNRLARELHDVLAHTLSGLAVELEGLRVSLGPDPARASMLLAHSQEAVREGLAETRRALQELRARPLEDLGLALAVQALAENYGGRSGLHIDLRLERDPGDGHPPDVQQCVYRIAQEALANVDAHAKAHNVRVVLEQADGRLKLTVTDDGCGFDPSTLQGNLHFGLLGMRERAEMLGGSLSIESQPGRGTQISFLYQGGPT